MFATNLCSYKETDDVQHKSSSSGHYNKLQQSSADSQNARNITRLRILLTAVLIAAAAVCTTMGFLLLSGNEKELFESQFGSIATSGLDSVKSNFIRQNRGLNEMAVTYSFNFPNSTQWPTVAWPGFRQAAELLGDISALDNIAFSPLVLPEELPEYEAYMKSYYENDDSIIAPNYGVPWVTLGMVWNFTRNDIPMRDTTGSTPNSPRKILTPIAQFTYSDTIGPDFLGYNAHTFSKFRSVFDAVMDCVEGSDNQTYVARHCGGISDAVELPFGTFLNPDPPLADIQAQLVLPIFPANNRSALVGFMSGAVSWKSLINIAIPSYVNGVDCVFSTGKRKFTYRVTDGVVSFIGPGDYHDFAYSKYERSAVMYSSYLDGTEGVDYTLYIYPRAEFEAEYSSNLPIYAAVALVVVFIICAVVFVAYDVLVQRESGRKEAILDTKRRFVRFISHEIRTPLNTVRLGMKLFESELSTVSHTVAKANPAEVQTVVCRALASWQSLVSDVLMNSETAVEVLDDLLNYDKIEMGTLRLEYSLFNVYDLIKKTALVMQIQAEQKSILLELVNKTRWQTVSGAEGDKVSAAYIIGDSYRMGQVLRNLISNALKFTPVGGNVCITVDFIEDGLADAVVPMMKEANSPRHSLKLRSTRTGSVLIGVKDSGAGLTAEQLERICEEGVQFNANELQAGQGSGLGLFISKGIVEQHGGHLTVDSEGPGKGVTFTVELPLFCPQMKLTMENVSYSSRIAAKLSTDENPDDSTDPADITRRPSETSSQSMKSSGTGILATISKKLLIVEDSRLLRRMMIKLLKSKDYACEEAEDGEKALIKYTEMVADNNTPHAILMDFEMPVMNGPTATAKLREMGCSCLIVGVTGNVLPADVTFFMEHGANAVLPKPLILEDLEYILYSDAVNHDVAVQRSLPSSLNRLGGGSSVSKCATSVSASFGKIAPLAGDAGDVGCANASADAGGGAAGADGGGNVGGDVGGDVVVVGGVVGMNDCDGGDSASFRVSLKALPPKTNESHARVLPE